MIKHRYMSMMTNAVEGKHVRDVRVSELMALTHLIKLVHIISNKADDLTGRCMCSIEVINFENLTLE